MIGAFGDLALELGALALGGAFTSASPVVEEVEFLLPCSAPESLWRRAVDSAREARTGVPAIVVRARLAHLRERALADPVAALLYAAHANASAPRAPVALMGIVNVTPDSFSDGGQYLDPARAIEHGLTLASDGAAFLDIGGESTRPGATPVSASEELRRVLPVVRGLAERARAGVRIAIDTTKAEVARAAVAAGASMVNDVSAGEADPDLIATVAELGVDLVLMHRQGDPATMQVAPHYGETLLDVAGYLRRRVRKCVDSGLAPTRLWLDPGIGFGKRLPHNLALLARARELRSLGLPLLVGPSRKSFIAHVVGAEREQDWAVGRRRDPASDRVGGTAAAVAALAVAAVDVIRVHDVRTMAEAARIAEAVAAVPRP